VLGLLREKGAEVSYYDPHVGDIQHEGWEMESVQDLAAAVKAADCVVLITDHKDLDYATVAKQAKLIFDTRNAFQRLGYEDEKIVRL
jgi:UDP-N-acetyl-D-glucosamine dehydrogenase